MTRHLPEKTRREQILSAARKCFIDKGFHPTRMEDIAATANLSKGGVYFHFESKQQVFDTLVTEEFEESLRFIRETASSPEPIAIKMQVLAAHWIEYFNTARDATRFFLVMGEMGLREPELARRLLEMQTVFIEEVGKLIEAGIAEGVLREVNARAAAALLKSLLDGVELLTALEYPLESAELLATGLEIVMNGLVKKP